MLNTKVLKSKPFKNYLSDWYYF